MIYTYKVLEQNKSFISKNLNINYSSVQKIIKAFEINGRTNKKQYIDLPYLDLIDERGGTPTVNVKSRKIKK